MGPLTSTRSPWVTVAAAGRQDVLDTARAAIAEWLEVAPDAFDVET